MTSHDWRLMLQPGRLRDLRCAAGYTQRGLAEKAGVTEETVGKLERGAHGAARFTLDAIADALKVDPGDLLPPPPPPGANLLALRPRLDALLEDYDAAERGSDDAKLAAFLRASLTARDTAWHHLVAAGQIVASHPAEGCGCDDGTFLVAEARSAS